MSNSCIFLNKSFIKNAIKLYDKEKFIIKLFTNKIIILSNLNIYIYIYIYYY